MFELIPSQRMQQIFEKNNFKLSDWNKATLIWNASSKTREERIQCLIELSEQTTDKVLRNQIQERVDFERTCMERFCENSCGKYVYVVEDKEGDAIGYFRDYLMAENYLKKDLIENVNREGKYQYEIKKQLIVSDVKDLKVESAVRFNPNMVKKIPKRKLVDYDGGAVGCVSFTDSGNPYYLWSTEMSDEEEEKVDSFKVERFESQYFDIPFEGDIGAIVKDVIVGDYGVLLLNTDDWNQFRQRDIYRDYLDIAVTVYYLTEGGIFSHSHVNPIYLEIVDQVEDVSDDDMKNELYKRAVYSFSEYWKKEQYLDEKSKQELLGEVIENSVKYSNECARSRIEKEREAVNKEDIKDIYSLMC